MIHRLELPTGLRIGPANVFFFPGPHPALFDAGALHPEGRAALREGLAAHGASIGDIELIVVSHAHVDHFGLAATVRAAGGARVLVHAAGVARMERHRNHYQEEVERLLALFARLGVPADQLPPFIEGRKEVKLAAADVAVDRTLAEGDTVALGLHTFTVLHLPGHSNDSIGLYDREAGLLLAGDVLMESAASYLALDLDGRGEGRRPWRGCLEDYLASLARLEGLALKTVLPGHGREFASVGSAIARNRRWYGRLKERAFQALANRPPAAPYDLAMELFPGLRGKGMHQAISLLLNSLEGYAQAGRVAFELTPRGYRVARVD